MKKMSQTENDKAFEYSIANSISKITELPIVQNSAYEVAKSCYSRIHNEKELELFKLASHEASVFLTCHDTRFEKATSIVLSDDSIGIKGDVRDVVIQAPEYEIGVSAKNNHKAVKHSRLSQKIDFGKKWADYPCSSNYFKAITPVFQDLQVMKEQKMFFLYGNEPKS